MLLSHVVVPGPSDEVVGIRTEGYLADAIVRWLLNFKVLHGIVRSRGAEALRKHSLRRSKRSTFPGSTVSLSGNELVVLVLVANTDR